MKNTIYILGFWVLTILMIACQSEEETMNYLDGYKGKVESNNPAHLSKAGKILFQNEYVYAEDYEYENYIDAMDLSISGESTTDLYFRAFQEKSLTNYLEDLAPEMGVDELLQNGNYQFSFYVDDQLIYTEDLNAGAGVPFDKNSGLVLCKPLLTVEGRDSWGCFLWKRFMLRNGGKKALTSGKHELKIELRAYLNDTKKKVSEIIAAGSIQLHMKENLKPIDPALVQMQNLVTHPDFEVKEDEVDPLQIVKLNQKIVQGQYKDVTSIIALKEGAIVLEEYFNDKHRGTVHDTRSVGKSITSMLVGMAIEEGYLKGANQSISDFYSLKKYPNFSQEKSQISLHDLLTMTSAFDASDEDSNAKGSEDQIQNSENWMDYTLGLATKSKTKKSWNYFTGGTMLLGEIINQSTPKGLVAFAEEKLLKPLAIKDAKWFYTPQGLPYGGGGFQMSSLDLAKIGQVYQNGGLWKGHRLLPSSWIEKTWTKHIDLPEDRKGSYGYLWYLMEVEYQGKMEEVAYAAGNGGNLIAVFKNQPLVIVITATAYNTMEGSVQGFEILEEVLQAMK